MFIKYADVDGLMQFDTSRATPTEAAWPSAHVVQRSHREYVPDSPL